MARLRTEYQWSNYPIGAVVEHLHTGDLGHVTGFARSYYDHGHETILKVMWDDGMVRDIHPANVILHLP